MRQGSANLAQYIKKKGIKAKLLHLESDTPTVAAAAAALGVEAEQIIKSLLFIVDGEPVLVISNGPSRVNRKLLADYLHMSRRRVKIASAEQLLEITGYPAGGVPPFGHREPLRTVVDAAVYSQPTIYGGGGDDHTLMRLAASELRRVVGNEAPQLTSMGS